MRPQRRKMCLAAVSLPSCAQSRLWTWSAAEGWRGCVERARRYRRTHRNRALRSRRHAERPGFLGFDATALFACQVRIAGEQLRERAISVKFGEMAGYGADLGRVFGLARSR